MIFMIVFDKFQTNPINCIYVDYTLREPVENNYLKLVTSTKDAISRFPDAMDNRQSKNHNDESEDFESLFPITRFNS